MSPHGLPSYAIYRSGDGASYDQLIQEFEAELQRQEKILSGITLFYDGVFLLLARQKDIVQTYRMQYRNIVRSARRVINWGNMLLSDARKDASKAPLLHSFNFTTGHGHPDPDTLVQRALLLVAAHSELFPGRELDQALSEDEILSLFERASIRLEELQS